jgi:uncharacterized membrane protein YcaP (DUF421 family)
MSLAHSFMEVPWNAVFISMGKTAVVYAFMLGGMRLLGKRAFRGIGIQEVVLATLLAKIAADHIVVQEAGLVSNLADGVTLFVMIYFVDRFPVIRHFVEGDSSTIYKNGMICHEVLKKYMMSENDLSQVARDYGRSSYKDFEQIILEKDGRLTGILKKEFLQPLASPTLNRQETHQEV